MFKLFVLFLLMSKVCSSQAATFCVDNSDDLQFVLNLAGSNNQDDTIKIEVGSYVSNSPSGGYGFVFENLDNDYSLDISGGWLSVFSNCDAQPSGNGQATIIDGEDTVGGMFIKMNETAANITVDNISFIDGRRISNSGGGLYFYNVANYVHTGTISITRNQFIANQASFGSALSVGNGSRINVKNNLFVANNAINNYTVSMIQAGGVGIYFTNNTIINNTGAGFRVAVSGTSQAMVANNLFWNNGAIDVALAGDGLIYLYHNNFDTIFNTPDFALGNLSEEPIFDSGGFLEYTPALSSSMINSGYMPFPFPFPPPFSRNWSLGTTDVLGKNRVQDNRVDIGAFEATAETPIFTDGFE